jgi:hypothetical protein
LLLTFVALDFTGCVPGQEPVAIGIPNVRPRDDVTFGLAGLEFDFLLSDKHFGGTMPKEAAINAHLDPKVALEWRVVSNGVHVEQYSSSGALIPTVATATITRSPDPRKPTGIRFGGLSSGPLYHITVPLEPTDSRFKEDVRRISRLKKAVSEQEKLAEELKRKWKENAENAAADLNIDAIRVTANY